MKTEKFIIKSREIHGERYGYLQTVFVNWKTPLIITCSVHGAFNQWPETHLKGAGCRRCKSKAAMAAIQHACASTFEDRARKIHKDRYNYSKTVYITSNQKIIITCAFHGDFEQTPSCHLQGQGCLSCAQESKKTSRNFDDLTKNFIKRSHEIHGNLYDYTNVTYVNNHTHVNLFCFIHGSFMQMPSIHLLGGGCKPCADIAKGKARSQKAAAVFLKKAKMVHSEKYDYSEAIYTRSSAKLKIICLKHGSFSISPGSFLSGSGCAKCGKEQMAAKQTTGISEFIAQAQVVHGSKYDYSKVNYVSTHRHVVIICQEHGAFLQSPSGHLRGRGCSKCGVTKCANNNRRQLEDFIAKARDVHGEKYDYSLAEYKSNDTKLAIICPQHGAFFQKPVKHYNAKQGCPSCVNKDMDITKFILRAREAHGDKYDYSQSIYTAAKAKVTIRCLDHGLFNQVAWNHMNGVGCIFCVDQLNSRGVQSIEVWLQAHKVSFIREKSFSDLKSLKRGNKSLRFDFFLIGLNILIEYDGQQHFEANSFWGGEKAFKELVKNDRRKDAWAKENGFHLIRISFDEENRIAEILSQNLKI